MPTVGRIHALAVNLERRLGENLLDALPRAVVSSQNILSMKIRHSCTRWHIAWSRPRPPSQATGSLTEDPGQELNKSTLADTLLGAQDGRELDGRCTQQHAARTL